tara:strand:+ start:739 stop:924 length:186 start_codon:yes stop_codon:yes gene_type:complete
VNNMFKIISKYKGGQFEVIDTTNSLKEANRLVQEYEMAFGNDYRIEFVKVSDVSLMDYRLS